MARARVLRSKMSLSLSLSLSLVLSSIIYPLLSFVPVADGERDERWRERERERKIPEGPAYTTAHRHRCVPFFVRNLKVVEGLTRKATNVEIYLAGMLLLARFVTRKLKPLPVFLSFLSFFFPIGWIGYRGFIEVWRCAFVPMVTPSMLLHTENFSKQWFLIFDI